MAKSRILLVDADARSARVVEVSLRQAGYDVLFAADLRSAMSTIDVQLPDLLLCDPRLGSDDGYELLRHLRKRPDALTLPVVLLLGARSAEDRIRGIELGIEDFIKKPVFVKELLARVDLALARGTRDELSRAGGSRTTMRGSLEDMTVLDLLQTFDMSKKSGVIHVVHGANDARVYLRNGDTVDAELGTLRGEEAVYRALTWRTGAFEVTFEAVDRPDVIHTPIGALLLEGVRRVDEWQRIAEELPPLNSVLTLDRAARDSRRQEIPPELDGILELVDGRKTIYEIVDSSPFDDLSTLATLAKLYFEGILRLTASRIPAPVLELTPRPPGSLRPPPPRQPSVEPPAPPAGEPPSRLATTTRPPPPVLASPASDVPRAEHIITARPPRSLPPARAVEEPTDLPAFTSVEAPEVPAREGDTIPGLAAVSRSSIPDAYEVAPTRSSRPDAAEVMPDIVFDKPPRAISFTNEVELEAASKAASDAPAAAREGDSSDGAGDEDALAMPARRVSGKTVAIVLAMVTGLGVVGIVLGRGSVRGQHDTHSGLELTPADAGRVVSSVQDASVPATDASALTAVVAPPTAPATAIDAGHVVADGGRVAVVPRVSEDDLKVEELLARAQRRIDEGNYSAAVHESRRATEREPGNPEAWLTLGAAYQARGDGEQARAAYRKCIVRAKGARLDECRALAGD